MTAPPSFSPKRGLRLGFLSLLALCAGLFGWGTNASLSGAVIAPGHVEVGLGKQIVEHLDGGTVVEVLAKNGDRVTQGAVLARLDRTALQTEITALQTELYDLMAKQAWLEAEVFGADGLEPDDQLIQVARENMSVRTMLDGHVRLFEARHRSRDRLITQLRERIVQSEQEIRGLNALEEAIDRQQNFHGRQLNAKRKLFERTLIPIDQMMDFEREGAILEGRKGEIVAEIASVRSRIAELELQISRVHSDRVENAELELREVQLRDSLVRSRLENLRARLARLDIKAPVAGTVHQFGISTVGEVLRPGEPVAELVPDDVGRVVKCRVEVYDIDQVWPGQEAVLTFSAFAGDSVPQYQGIVSWISADAVYHEQVGQSWYEVRVEIHEPLQVEPGMSISPWLVDVTGRITEWLRKTVGHVPANERDSTAAPDNEGNGRPLTLAPGMPVDVFLSTGERSPLNYLVRNRPF